MLPFNESKTWEASGHLGNFNDPMIDNKDSKIRYRADKLIEDYMQNEKVTKISLLMA